MEGEREPQEVTGEGSVHGPQAQEPRARGLAPRLEPVEQESLLAEEEGPEPAEWGEMVRMIEGAETSEEADAEQLAGEEEVIPPREEPGESRESGLRELAGGASEPGPRPAVRPPAGARVTEELPADRDEGEWEKEREAA